VTSISLANSSSARSLPLTTAVRTATMAISAPANSRELTDLLERQHDLQRLTTLYRTSTARKPTNIEKEHERQDWT
jgi:hypothetical protein